MKFSIAVLSAAMASASVIHGRSAATDVVDGIHNTIYAFKKEIDGFVSIDDLDAIFQNFAGDISARAKKLAGLAVDVSDQMSLVQLSKLYPAIGTTIQFAIEGNKVIKCRKVHKSLDKTKDVFSQLSDVIHDKVAEETREDVASHAAQMDKILNGILNDCADPRRKTVPA